MSNMNKTILSKILPAGASLCAVALFAVSANLVFGSIVKVAKEFNIQAELFAMVASVQFAGFLVSSIIGGILSDKFGRKIIIQTACIMLSLGALIWGISNNIMTCYLGSIFLGLGGGILESISCVILMELFPGRKKMVLNISQVCYCLGAVGSLFALGWLMPNGASWRIFFFIMSILSLVLYLLFFVSRFDVPDTLAEQQSDSKRIKPLLITWSFIAPCIALFCYVFAEAGTATFINIFLQNHYHAPERWAIYALATFWSFMVFGRILCAFIPEKISPKTIISLLSFSAALLFIVQYFLSSWIASFIFFALLGFSFAGIWPLIVNLTAVLNPRSAGTVVGITVAVGAAGCIVAPAVLGYLFSKLNIPLVWALLAIPMILCGIITIAIPNHSSDP